MNYRLLGLRAAAGVDNVEVFLERRVDGHHGAGLFVGGIETPLGIEHHHLLAVAERFNRGALCGVVLLWTRGESLADQGIGANLHLRTGGHLHLFILVECGAGQADENQHHAKMDDVTAIAARVAHGELPDGGEEIEARARANHSGAAEEFGGDGQGNEDGEDQANQRVEVAEAQRVRDRTRSKTP